MKTIPNPIDNWNDGFNICCIARPHLTTNWFAMIVNDRPNDHLIQVWPMIFAVTFVTNGCTAFSFKVDRGGIKKYKVKTCKKITALMEQIFFNDIFGATW